MRVERGERDAHAAAQRYARSSFLRRPSPRTSSPRRARPGSAGDAQLVRASRAARPYSARGHRWRSLKSARDELRRRGSCLWSWLLFPSAFLHRNRRRRWCRYHRQVPRQAVAFALDVIPRPFSVCFPNARAATRSRARVTPSHGAHLLRRLRAERDGHLCTFRERNCRRGATPWPRSSRTTDAEVTLSRRCTEAERRECSR